MPPLSDLGSGYEGVRLHQRVVLCVCMGGWGGGGGGGLPWTY